MQYILLFLEGMITFISPCMLPMLPIYISYFAGDCGETKRHKAFFNAIGFVIGFSILFIAMGAFAGTFGRLLQQYLWFWNVVTGGIVVLFGLYFLGVFKLRFRLRLGNTKGRDWHQKKQLGFVSSMVFGIIFSVGWTPCVGAFLGSALAMAAMQGSGLQGILMLLCFSLGLGVPFIVSAVFINQLKTTFDWVKAHYKIINAISGCFLIVMGILMMSGLMGYFLSLFTF